MKRRYDALWGLVLLGFTVAIPAADLPDFTHLAKKYGPAVVNISTKQARGNPHSFNVPDLPDDSPLRDFFRHFFGEQGQLPDNAPQARSLGSGFFISADGYILTNHHVVKDAEEVIVRTNDGRDFQAKVIGSDRRSDTALLKVTIEDAPVVDIGKSKDLEVGAWVLAIGSPFGFDHSVTAGIVSAVQRSLPSENYVPFIQTDVAINPGNSGGPLISLEGKVVGINSQIYSRTGGFMGLSFAIPIDLAMNVVEQIKARGHVTRGWLGVMIQDVTRELAETFDLPSPRGALVAQVLPDSPAEKAEIQVGDVILNYNGHDLLNSSDLPPLVGASPIDRPSTLLILRDGKKREFKVVIGELPDEEAMPTNKLGGSSKDALTTDRLGLSVRDLTPRERQENNLKSGGVIIEKIGAGAGREAGLRTGDVILMLNNAPIRTVADLREQLKNLADGRSVAMLVQRDEGRLFLPLRIPAR